MKKLWKERTIKAEKNPDFGLIPAPSGVAEKCVDNKNIRIR